VRQALQDQSQVSLRELCERQPLQHGLAELIAYLQLDGDSFRTVIDEHSHDIISWRSADDDGGTVARRAHLPRVIYVRTTNG
jgi:hypothetical protein